MASVVSSDLFIFNEKRERLDEPVEWEPFLVARPLADFKDWSNAEIRFQGQTLRTRLEKIQNDTYVCADAPLCGPGNFQVIFFENGEDDRFEFIITSTKISPQDLNILLEELQSRLPLALGIELTSNSASVGTALVSLSKGSIPGEILKLRRIIWGDAKTPSLLQVTQQIGAHPNTSVVFEDQWVPAQLARRPRPNRLVNALTRPNNVNPSTRYLRGVIDERVRVSHDTYENGLLKLLFMHLLNRISTIKSFVGQKSSRYDELNELRKAVETAKSAATFMDEVRLPTTFRGKPTMVLLQRPEYKVLYQKLVDLQKNILVFLDAPELGDPLNNLPTLYELWLTLVVFEVTNAVATELGFVRVAETLAHVTTLGLTIKVNAGNEPLAVFERENEVIKFFYKRSYHSGSNPRSISNNQIPDITILYELSGRLKALIFDPKYKTDRVGNPRKDDIDKMHVYRDAIRDRDERVLVLLAATIYPGPMKSYTTGLRALQGLPSYVESLSTELRQILSQFLRATDFV